MQSYGYIKDPKGDKIALDGTKVRKVNTWSKEDIVNKRLYEHDVPVETRFLVDNYYESDITSKNHNIFFFDIEVSMVGGVSEATEAANEITAISYYSSKTKKYISLILDPDSKIPSGEIDGVQIYSYDTEKFLIKDFLKQYQKINPTIITGWNTNGFDIPYLINRITKILNTSYYKKLSPINIVRYSEFKDEWEIAGVSALDYLTLYKKLTFNEQSVYTLDAIARFEIGKGKIEYAGSLDSLYKEDIHKFVKYNIVDVELVVEIDKKKQFLDLAMNICHKGHVPYDNIYQTSRWLEGASLVYLKKIDIIAPAKPDKINLECDHTRAGADKIILTNTLPPDFPGVGQIKIKKTKTSDFKVRYREIKNNCLILTEPLPEAILDTYKIYIDLPGAYVKHPQKGRHEWVYDLDLVSLYPSIIMTLNISPETKIGKVLNWQEEEYAKDIEKTYNLKLVYKNKTMKLSSVELKAYLTDNKYSIASNGVFYRTDRKGLIPTILETWFKERVEYKDLMKKHGNAGNDELYKFYYIRQYVQKVMLNSFYGVLGLTSFRFYDIENAEAITLSGQSIIRYSDKMANYYYNKELNDDIDHVKYVDTDSLFLSALPLIKHRYPTININDDTVMSKRIIEIATDVQAFINKSYDIYSQRFHNIDNHRFHIKQELIGKAGLWIAKKRYAIWVINKETVPVDEIEIKGLDVVRSDYPKAFQTFMSDVLWDILKKKTEEQITDNIIDFRAKLNDLPILDIMIPTGIKNIKKYNSEYRSKFEILKGTPWHVKAALRYNDLLDHLNIKSVTHIKGGEKIKIAYLKQNPFNLESIALRGYDDPKEVFDLVSKHLDIQLIFENLLISKFQDFYDAIGWGKIILNNKASQFFKF